jgi:hypothetical protein
VFSLDHLELSIEAQARAIQLIVCFDSKEIYDLGVVMYAWVLATAIRVMNYINIITSY